MARMARAVAAGLPHHVTQRGNRRQRTFFGDDDYRAYLRYAREEYRRHDVAVWAWCLMPNHVHLVAVPATAPALALAVGETHRRYSRTVNARMGWHGYLWQGRFASVVLDEMHLYAAVRYVELNPVRAGLAMAPQEWPWSSAAGRLAGVADGLCEPEPLASLVPDWRGYLDAGIDRDTLEILRRHTRTGRPLGDEAFLDRLEADLGRQLRARKVGRKPKHAKRGDT